MRTAALAGIAERGAQFIPSRHGGGEDSGRMGAAIFSSNGDNFSAKKKFSNFYPSLFNPLCDFRIFLRVILSPTLQTAPILSPLPRREHGS
jgi:hypothetical protein